MKLTSNINCLQVLDEMELDLVIETAYSILEKTGFNLEHEKLLVKLADHGARTDKESQKVYLSRNLLEDFLNKIKRKTWTDSLLTFTAEAEIYHGYFLDPADDRYKPWSHESLLNYIRLANKLPGINGSYMLGCPVDGVPQKIQPLYEKLYCWKYGIRGGEGIWDTELCDPLYRMHEIYARSVNRDVGDVFHGVVYLVSPLKLGSHEARQFWYFYERGLFTSIRSGGGTLGGNYPVTLPGALAVCLAENLMIALINYVLFNRTEVQYIASISSIDMKSAAFQYGRPEKSLSILAEAQIAKRLGFDYHGHSGLSDAKAPGFEAGVQKMITAMFNASVCGKGNIVAGLLGADEIFSPVQMILENELTGALNHICRGVEVDEETLAYAAIQQTGPGGNFLASEHTALNFGSSLWQSSIWSDRMFHGWMKSGGKKDTDIAREIYMEITREKAALEIFLDEGTENRLLDVIHDTK